jgi:PAS domain S-box-containing protein
VITWACAQVLLIALCVHSFLDASRQDEAEWQVQQVAQLQRSILDSAGPMILATDLEGNLLIFNPAAERMLGYRFHEVLGQLNAHDLFPEGELERVGQLLVSRLDRSPAIDLESVSAELKHYVQYVTSFPVSRVRGFEILCRRKDATTFPAMVYLSAVRNTEGALTGLLAIATDLTATKRAEHALARERRALPRPVRQLAGNDCHPEPAGQIPVRQSRPGRHALARARPPLRA